MAFAAGVDIEQGNYVLFVRDGDVESVNFARADAGE